VNAAARIAAWLPQARWFAAKGAAAPTLAIGESVSLPGGRLSLTLLDVATPNGTERYVAPLADDADASLEPGFAAWLVAAVQTEAMLAGRHGTFRGHAATPRTHVRGGAADCVRALGGDASNTSLLVEHDGRAYAVKLLRRCRSGTQPEVEIGEFFSRHARWDGTPRFLGWLEYASTAGESIAIATLHEFVSDCTTAWDRLVPLMAHGGLAGARHDEILGVVDTLGRTTAEMHVALASRADVAAFAPEVAGADASRAEADRMRAHATQVFTLAAARLATLPPPVAVATAGLASRRDAINATLGRLADVEHPGMLIRVHGDFHLGQVLLRGAGPEAFVIDFEGEPGRSLADRRRKTTPVKDVAGMCRSLDYLLRHAARVGSAAYENAHLRLLEARYLGAYRAVAEGRPWWPADPAVAAELLSVYKLDKALYELAYELTNRPDWVDVPLAALLTEDRL